MNNINAEWQREYYLTHDKYRMHGQGTDCYKVVKGLTRILQLPTITKLTTDNESVISDFRLNRGEYGLEPYDEYTIKVDDTYGASLYILVHKRANATFLCPILVGFEGENTCAMVKPTDNWRMREMAAFVELRRAEEEFGVDGLMMAVNTRNGVYGYLSVLNESGNLLEAYTAKERSVLDCAEEMADVMEVLYAMGKTCDVSKREVEQVRSQKAAEKGTFSKKIFLVSTGEERREP